MKIRAWIYTMPLWLSAALLAGYAAPPAPVVGVADAVQLIRDGVVSLDRMATAAWDEPPRVRAMLGALAEAVEAPATVVERYREMVHPCSRYAFGPLRDLPTARSWGAR